MPLPSGMGPLLRWHNGCPYINWGAIVASIGCGYIKVIRSRDNGFAYESIFRLRALPAVIKSQWRTSNYLSLCLQEDLPLPDTLDERLLQSVALGLALLALTLRLPVQDEKQRAMALANPSHAPRAQRKTIIQMLAIQNRRTALSPAWQELFPERRDENLPPEGLDYFWNEPSGAVVPDKKAIARTLSEGIWQGLPVCPGSVSGPAFFIGRVSSKQAESLSFKNKVILVFPQARPETVSMFPFAAGLVFGEGGALSHACCVAREQGIPCVTGLGTDFIRYIQENKDLELSVDGERGCVSFCRAKDL